MGFSEVTKDLEMMRLAWIVQMGLIYSQFFKTEECGTSGEDGGVGRQTVPPHTIKRRTATNLKTKNNQN